MLIERLRYKVGNRPFVFLNKEQKETKKKIENNINRGIYKFEKVDCVLCGSNEFEEVSSRDRYGLYVPVSICKRCGLVQTNPRMDKKSYDDFYRNYYGKLYMGTRGSREHHFIWQYNHGRQIFNWISKNTNKKIQGLRVVEVGSSAGGILKCFKDNGNDVVGFDLDKDEIRFGKDKGLDLRIGTIEDLEKSGIKADLIILSHVLEHILNPAKELKKIKNCLNDRGMVYIEVPGIENVYDFFESDIGRYFQNAHVYHFTQNSLKNLASKTGFDVAYSDRFIHSILKPLKISTKSRPPKNDYVNVKREILRLEKKRKNIFSIKLMKARILRNGLYFLRWSGLYRPIKWIYFKVSKKESYIVIP